MGREEEGAGGIRLPARSTRGKRMRAAMEDEDEADQAFWNQEFFAEEQADIDYEAEEEVEDVPDSDFDDPEDDDDDDEVVEVDERPKKKALKAPEPKAPPKARAPKPKPKKADSDEEDFDAEDEDEDADDDEDEEARAQRLARKAQEKADRALARKQAAAAAAAAYAAPSLRHSTMAKVAVAVQQRAYRDQVKPERRKSNKVAKVLSQAELLAEAARTEIENIQSLKLLLAMEEETKKKAAIVKTKYAGPMVKVMSVRRPIPGSGVPAAGSEEGQAAGEQAAQAEGSEAGAKEEEKKQAAAEAGKEEGSKEGKAAGSKKEKVKDTTEYEGLYYYEIVNMHYPPMWLRRYRALPPPPPPPCPVTGLKAKYKDPETGTFYANATAFRQLRNLPPAASPAPGSAAAAGAGGAAVGAGSVTGGPAHAAAAEAVTKAVQAQLPPEPESLPPPTTHFPMVQPMGVSLDMMALMVDMHRSLYGTGGGRHAVAV